MADVGFLTWAIDRLLMIGDDSHRVDGVVDLHLRWRYTIVEHAGYSPIVRCAGSFQYPGRYIRTSRWRSNDNSLWQSRTHSWPMVSLVELDCLRTAYLFGGSWEYRGCARFLCRVSSAKYGLHGKILRIPFHSFFSLRHGGQWPASRPFSNSSRSPIRLSTSPRISLL
jgi:hypothetical protein